MAIQNVIDKKTQDLTIDPGASGDSFVQFNINTTNEFKIGVDDDAADAFKVSQGGALGVNDTMVITANGEITLPLQPAFLAYVSATINNVTGDNSIYTIIEDTEVFDVTGDYDHTTGEFTAPRTGKYVLFGNVHLVVDVTGGNEAVSFIWTSNNNFISNNIPTKNRVANFYGANNAISLGGSVVCDMDAADVATYRVESNNGALADDVYGGADCYTYFAGYLAV